jgi:hypothetical protein
MPTKCDHNDRYVNGKCRPCTRARKAKYRAARTKPAASRKKPLTQRIHVMLHSARVRAKQKGFPKPTINTAWVRERLERGVCELSGLQFEPWTRGTTAFIPSIDRIDSSKGYDPENCRIIVWALNAAFAEWGEDTFRFVARAWLAKRPGCDLI